MAVPTTQWDETSPAGSDNISQGDDRIRELKTQLREVISADHEMTSTQTAATGGQHKQVTLQEQADLGTGAVDATILGSQTVSGKGELVYTDEDDNDIQLTTGGVINAAPLAVADTKILVGNGSGVATAVAVSGDATIANTGAVAVSDLTIASQADGDLLQFDGTNWIRVPKGTAGQVLESDGTDVAWGDGFASALDYGTSASASTAKTLPALHVCYGSVTIAGNSTQAITNLPFTGATTYSVTASFNSAASFDDGYPGATMDSGSQCTLANQQASSRAINWIAIGT